MIRSGVIELPTELIYPIPADWRLGVSFFMTNETDFGTQTPIIAFDGGVSVLNTGRVHFRSLIAADFPI